MAVQAEQERRNGDLRVHDTSLFSGTSRRIIHDRSQSVLLAGHTAQLDLTQGVEEEAEIARRIERERKECNRRSFRLEDCSDSYFAQTWIERKEK